MDHFKRTSSWQGLPGISLNGFASGYTEDRTQPFPPGHQGKFHRLHKTVLKREASQDLPERAVYNLLFFSKILFDFEHNIYFTQQSPDFD
jgi:hypothetical protein